MIINDTTEGYKCRFTGFYGSPYPQERVEAWNPLRHLGMVRKLPWMVCGDFNEILYSFEKKGGLSREEGRMEAFRKVLEECSLSDMGFNGNWFTWERGNLPETNIQKGLDRGVANEEWLQIFLEFQIQHLPHTFSNHCPLLVHTKKECRERVHKEFKFKAWWDLEDSFLE